MHSYDCLFFYFVVTDVISATLNNLYLSKLNTLAFLLMLSKLPSAPFPLKQFLLITCTLTIAYFWLVATDAHLVHLKQPSSFTTMAFLLLLSKRPSVPFPLKQLLLITCTLTITYDFFYFVVTNLHLIHLKQHFSLIVYSCLFVVVLQTSTCTLSIDQKQLLSHALLQLLIFDFHVTDAHLVYLTQPSFFPSLLLPFCYWCSNFHMHPFKYTFSIKATVITCTLMIAYFFDFFVTNAHLIHLKQLLSVKVYSCLFCCCSPTFHVHPFH